jgi:hypothetical protein
MQRLELTRGQSFGEIVADQVEDLVGQESHDCLNPTQKNVVEAYLVYPLQEIYELTPKESIKALMTVLAPDVTDQQIEAFKQLGIWDTVKTLRDILNHKNPQNRNKGDCQALCELEKEARDLMVYFESDGNVVADLSRWTDEMRAGAVYKGRVYFYTHRAPTRQEMLDKKYTKPEIKIACSEEVGLLGLTVFGPATKEATVEYISQLIIKAINEQELLTATESEKGRRLIEIRIEKRKLEELCSEKVSLERPKLDQLKQEIRKLERQIFQKQQQQQAHEEQKLEACQVAQAGQPEGQMLARIRKEEQDLQVRIDELLRLEKEGQKKLNEEEQRLGELVQEEHRLKAQDLRGWLPYENRKISCDKWLLCVAKNTRTGEDVIFLNGVYGNLTVFMVRYEFKKSLLGLSWIAAKRISEQEFKAEEPYLDEHYFNNLTSFKGRALMHSIHNDVVIYMEKRTITASARSSVEFFSSPKTPSSTDWAAEKLQGIRVALSPETRSPKKVRPAPKANSEKGGIGCSIM